ncbi:MAG: outer membrane beta-barrel protein [Cyanobacteria bacterium P01_A01_bin.83]
MNIKAIVLGIVLATGIPIAAQAQDADKHESQLGCTSIECSNLNANYEQNYEQSSDNEVAQTRRTRTRRTRRSTPDSKFRIGGHLAPFIPFDGELDVGFGGGIFGGYKLTKNISLEIDVYDYFGGTETDDLDYNIFGAAVNGVYRYHLNFNDSRNPYIFAGLGVGVGVVDATGDVADDAEDAGIDTSATGFLLQGKGGVGYPITDRIDLFGQTRFFSVFLDDDDFSGAGDDDDADGVAIDIGATFNF